MRINQVSQRIKGDQQKSPKQKYKMSTQLQLNSSVSRMNKQLLSSGEQKTGSTEMHSKMCENCRLIKEELQGQIFSLKDKSHQSFMQVMYLFGDIDSQVQQLHEEEMQLLKAEHEEEVQSLKEQILKLGQKINLLTIENLQMKSQLQLLQRNYKHHICQFESPSFHIDNIEVIQCSEDINDPKEKLDDSQLCQFNQFVSPTIEKYPRPEQSNNNFQSLYDSSYNNPIQYEDKINHLNLRILELQSQVESLFETNQQLTKQNNKLQLTQKTTKNNYDSLFKQSKFMADHIRTLANDKFKLQRKVKQLEKQLKDNNLKGLKQSTHFDDRSSLMNSVKINGSGLYASHQFANVNSSIDNSIDSKDIKPNINQTQKQPITKTMSIQNFSQKKQIQIPNPMTQSQFLHVNKDLQQRKSMPSYKKVSHISPSPSFKKPLTKAINQKSPLPFKLGSHQSKVDEDKSDFMQQIRRQIQLKAINLKKVSTIQHDKLRPPSLFNDLTKKRSNTKN